MKRFAAYGVVLAGLGLAYMNQKGLLHACKAHGPNDPFENTTGYDTPTGYIVRSTNTHYKLGEVIEKQTVHSDLDNSTTDKIAYYLGPRDGVDMAMISHVRNDSIVQVDMHAAARPQGATEPDTATLFNASSKVLDQKTQMDTTKALVLMYGHTGDGMFTKQILRVYTHNKEAQTFFKTLKHLAQQ